MRLRKPAAALLREGAATTLSCDALQMNQPPTKHGPWQIVSSEEVYRDHWLAVRKDEVVRPDGLPGTYSVAALMPGVCVLALGDQKEVYLTEEFHYGVGRTTVEAVSGGIEAGEDPITTARRELAEELGISAGTWTDLGCVDPLTGSVVSPTQLYLAQQLRFGAVAPEGTERIRCVKMPLRQAVEEVLGSRITHGPSCVAILKVALSVDTTTRDENTGSA